MNNVSRSYVYTSFHQNLQLIHEQLKRTTALATRRGSRSITVPELFFLIRHDKAKTSRLKTFLSWKEVRRTARESDDKGGDAADAGVGDDPLGGADGAGGPAVPLDAKKGRKRIKLPWDISSFFSEQLPEGDDDDDEEEEEMNAASLLRLRQSDQRTKAMTREEYIHYSECRQASFTYKKSKRFKEWAGFGVVTDSKPNDDIVDILGFLLYDNVQTLTEEALKVKAEEDLVKARNGQSNAQSKKRKLESTLFAMTQELTAPVEPKHIREAYRRLQAKPIPGRCTVWLGGYRALQRKEVKLVSAKSVTLHQLYLLTTNRSSYCSNAVTGMQSVSFPVLRSTRVRHLRKAKA